jgi:hypothetical protein
VTTEIAYNEHPLHAPGICLGTVVQALQYLGKSGLDEKAVKHKAKLSPRDKKTLLKESRYAVGWSFEAVNKIGGDQG